MLIAFIDTLLLPYCLMHWIFSVTARAQPGLQMQWLPRQHLSEAIPPETYQLRQAFQLRGIRNSSA
jgi:hypothetical protein